MLQGYPFYGTGAIAPTVDNSTILDPILEASVTGITQRGKSKQVHIMGMSFNTDIPALGSRLELRVGNQPTPARVIDAFPQFDSNISTQLHQVLNYIDLGGIPVNEDEFIDIRMIDPGAAEIMSGVLWVEDHEPEIPIPKGQMVTLKFGGTNDCGTTLAVTGFDMDSRKLINERLYTPYDVEVRPEDQAIQAMIMRAEKDSMTLPPIGRMIYGKAPLQFTGQQYNSGQVIGKMMAVAATKVEIIMRLIESEGQNKAPSNAPQVAPASAPSVPGIVGAGTVTGAARASVSSGAFGGSPRSIFRG